MECNVLCLKASVEILQSIIYASYFEHKWTQGPITMIQAPHLDQEEGRLG